MVAGFLGGALGSLIFALSPRYSVAVVSLFTIGAGMAILQVAINPLLRKPGAANRDDVTLRHLRDHWFHRFLGDAVYHQRDTRQPCKIQRFNGDRLGKDTVTAANE